jgi:hydroxymethylbilane synthase
VSTALEAGCAAPVGALAEVVDGEGGPELSLRAVVVSIDGAVALRRGATVPLPETLHGVGGGASGYGDRAAALGGALAAELLGDGAAELMPIPASVSPRSYQTRRQAREGDV